MDNKTRLTAAVVAMFSAVAAVRAQSFTYDLRFAPGTANLIDSHDVTVSATGGTVTLQLWGQITGDGNPANDGWLYGFVGVGSTQNGGGAFSGGGITAGLVNTTTFDAATSRNGTGTDFSGDGLTDWGSNATSSATGWTEWAAGIAKPPPGVLGGTPVAGLSQAVNANTWEILLATYTVNVGGSLGTIGTTKFNVASGLTGVVSTGDASSSNAPVLATCIDTGGGTNAQTNTAITSGGVSFFSTAAVVVPSGTIVLTNTSYASTINISGPGTLQIGNGNTLGQLSGGPVSNNGNMIFSRSGVSTNSATIGGSGSVTLVGSGTTILTGAANYSGPTSIVAGLLQFGGGVTHNIGTIGIGGGGLTINAGTTLVSKAVSATSTGLWTINGTHVIAVGSGTSQVTSPNLVIGATGQLDLTKNKLIVEGTDAASDNAIALNLSNLAATAYVGVGGLRWTGAGVTSSTVAADASHGTSLAIAIGSDLSPTVRTNLGVDNTGVVVVRSVLGDVDLNGTVGTSDLIAIYNNFGSTNGKWTSGAMERSAVTGQPLAVGTADLIDVYNHFGGSTPAIGGVGIGSSGTTLVPEPASLSILALGIPLLLKRRRGKVQMRSS